MSKLDMNNMESWGFDEYAQYLKKNKDNFKAHMEKNGNAKSEDLESMLILLHNIHETRKSKVTQDSVLEMTGNTSWLQRLSSNYFINNGNKVTDKDSECMKVMEGLSKHCNENAYNRLRDPNIMKEYQGKRWRKVNEIPSAEVEVNTFTTSVGEAASDRFNIIYNNKKGFFTPKNVIVDENKLIETMLEDIKNPKQREEIGRLKDEISGLAQSAVQASQTGLTEYAALQLDIYSSLNERNENESFKKIFWENYNDLVLTRNDYQEQVSEKKLSKPEEKRKLLEDIINKQRFSRENEENDKIRESFLENKERIFECVDKKFPKITGEEAFKARMDSLLVNKIMQKETSALELFNDPQAKDEMAKIMKKVYASYLAQSKDLGGLKVGAELSGRNTASTRIADKLGVGNLLARSQDMVIKVGDKEMKGCFMEFAEGIDMRNCKGEDLKRLSKVNLTNTPGFTKDMCNLEILDFICAQADRHAGNIFLKLDENNRPIGLQGIDNDMCLSDFSKNHKGEPIPMKQGQLKDLHFISEDMANKIQTITPDDLKCLVGDKIDSDELEALNGRVKEVQEHIKKNMFIVKDDKDWQLDGDMFEHLGKPEGLSDIEARRLFAKAWVELNDGLKMNNANPIHHNTSILKEIDRAKKRYEKESQKEEIQDKKEDLKKTEPKKEEPKPDSIKKTAEAVPEKEHESKENEKTETQKEAPENDVKKEANSAKAIPPRPGFRRGVGVGAVIAGKTPEEIKELTKDLTIGEDGLIRRKDELKSKKESWVSGKKEHLKDTPQRDIKMGARRTTQKSNPMGNHAETVPEKTTATVENLKEDGTEKIKTYEDGSKVKIVSSSDGQFIRSEGFRKRDDKRKAMNLTELVKSFSEQTKAVQRDADERKQQRDEAKKAAQIQNELDNPILDEMGYDRGFVKTKEKLENPWSIMKNASRTTRAQMELADKKRNANEKKAEGKDSKFEDTRSKKDIAKNGGRQM